LSLENRTARLDVTDADAATHAHAGCGRGVLRPKAALHAGGGVAVHRPHIRERMCSALPVLRRTRRLLWRGRRRDSSSTVVMWRELARRGIHVLLLLPRLRGRRRGDTGENNDAAANTAIVIPRGLCCRRATHTRRVAETTRVVVQGVTRGGAHNINAAANRMRDPATCAADGPGGGVAAVEQPVRVGQHILLLCVHRARHVPLRQSRQIGLRNLERPARRDGGQVAFG
jgi:hypothetical protein